MMGPAANDREPVGWKELAWNGVRVEIPPVWEPARIGARHLLIESETGPAMELKWGPVRGQFSHRSHFRRLLKVAAGRGGHARQCALPAAWQEVLRRFESAGFSWVAGGTAATGAILYCPRSRTGGLVQFFHPPAESSAIGLAAAVLDHLQFNDPSGPARWAVFDIRAELPGRFALVHHRFEPGRFIMRLAAGRCRIDLHRWAPAAVLLTGCSLIRFAQTLAGWGSLQFHTVEGPGPPAVEGHTPAAAGLWERLAEGFGLRTVCRARLWHVPERNRILGLSLQERGGIDSDAWEMAIRTYGVVDIKAAAGLHQPR
ncbi:MAG: hypothetical protein R6V84_10400 [Desulfobacterales bacterium]